MNFNQDYSSEEAKLLDWIIPFAGFYNYVQRNVKHKTTDTNNYANGFFHLLLANITEAIVLGNLSIRGLESFIN